MAVQARLGAALIVLVLATGLAEPTDAQERGDAASTAGGILLGGSSGAALGLLGSAFPCNRAFVGSTCAAVGTATGALVGSVAGGVIGSESSDLIGERLADAGIGSLVGAGVGLVLWRAVRQYGWEDALTVAALGGAFGSAPMGSGYGAALGAAVGGVVWLTVPRAGLQDFLLATVVGATVGGLADWGRGAVRAGRAPGPAPFVPSFSIPVR